MFTSPRGCRLVPALLAAMAFLAATAFADGVLLEDVNSAITSPTGGFRWLDVADQAYAQDYRGEGIEGGYNYQQATVALSFQGQAETFHGTFSATNLKPNFAYQLKLVGTAGAPCNERIGLAGRWWQEQWNGTAWADGWNLNSKGDGISPSPNDQTYFDRRGITDPTSPTGLKYKYTAYLVFAYFITDEHGDAHFAFEARNSYHVLWKTTQRGRTAGDGPLVTATFDPAPAAPPAYSADYPSSTVSIFGEWERLPQDEILLAPGEYDCQVLLTEESFHGSGGSLAGSWAAAMGKGFHFTIFPERHPDVSGDGCVNVADLLFVRNSLGQTGSHIAPPGSDVNGDGVVNVVDLLIVRNEFGKGCE